MTDNLISFAAVIFIKKIFNATILFLAGPVAYRTFDQ